MIKLKAYRDGKDFKVWCKFCSSWHTHGNVLGHKAAHCFKSDSEYLDTGYSLEDAGEFTTNTTTY